MRGRGCRFQGGDLLFRVEVLPWSVGTRKTMSLCQDFHAAVQTTEVSVEES